MLLLGGITELNVVFGSICCSGLVIYQNTTEPGTYDHTQWNTRGLVRSPIDKPLRGRLVVGSVTTSEHRLLYVLYFFCCFLCKQLGVLRTKCEVFTPTSWTLGVMSAAIGGVEVVRRSPRGDDHLDLPIGRYLRCALPQ